MNYFYYDRTMMYPRETPYDPETDYPEYHEQIGGELSTENHIYEAIRNMFIATKMDNEHIGTANWNPLGESIRPGDSVLIKPNLVVDHNPAEEDFQKGMECAITHPSIVRCIFDYVCIALKREGRIIIADAPIQGCDFEAMKKASGYDRLFSYVESKAGGKLEVITGDLRSTVFTKRDGTLFQADNKERLFDECIVDLGKESCFYTCNKNRKLRVTDYDGAETMRHHTGERNEYCVNSCVLESDVIINICKPKTHRIAGYTGAMKNMVGINARKEYLPHHSKGAAGHGGDEYQPTHQILKFFNSTLNDLRNHALREGWRKLSRLTDQMARRIGMRLDRMEDKRKKFGMWHGNDTIWRTIMDLNRIVMFCDKKGSICSKEQRRILHFGDMVISGEKEGPLQPSWKHVGGILFSDNAVSFDYVLVKLMGFDYKKFPLLVNSLEDYKLDKKEPIVLQSNAREFDGQVDKLDRNFAYIPTDGWKEVLIDQE